MRKNNINLPPSGMIAKGRYEAQVIEPAGLSRMRRKAFSTAGLSGDYDGSVAAYKQLDSSAKSAHDKALSSIVSKALRTAKRRGKNSSARDARVVFSTGERDNLALDQGLNKMLRSSGTISWASWSNYCAAGVGTTPTFTDSGATTATSAGTTVTASGSFFTAGMVGQLIKFDSGEERYITAQAGTTCTINSALTIGSPTLFCVWAVNQSGLASESKRSNTYLTGVGNCGSSWASNVWSGKRTYDFSAEVGNVNYTELGWSDLGGAGSNLNARTLISGGTVSVLIGQQLRVIYTISFTATPNASTPGTYSITGWPVAPSVSVDGDYMICNPTSGIIDPSINTSGNVSNSGAFPFNRTASAPTLHLATGTALPAFGNNYSAGSTAASDSQSYSSYTDQDFYLDIQSVWNLSTGNATNWRGIYAGSTSGFAFVFDQDQTKASTHTLTVRARMSVGRTLVNP